MSVGGFKILQEVGVLPSTEGSEIRFSIDEYRGYKYGSIRKYLNRDSYNGPTRSGITMSAEIIAGILDVLEKLPKEPHALADVELGKFAKRPGLSVVARITIYRDATGIDLREWQEDTSYTGWTKKGIRLPYEHIGLIIDYLKKMKNAMPVSEAA